VNRMAPLVGGAQRFGPTAAPPGSRERAAAIAAPPRPATRSDERAARTARLHSGNTEIRRADLRFDQAEQRSTSSAWFASQA